jgi:type VI secretion system secreted protein Hcp
MAFDAYLKIDGIQGESMDSKHKDEIEVHSFSWGATQTGTSEYGSGGGAGRSQVHDFNFVHKIDKASPLLFQKLVQGEHIAKADFFVRKAGGEQLEYLKYKFKDVLVSSIRPGGMSNGSDEIPLEEVSLNFAEVEVEYQPQGKDGKAQGGPILASWKLKEHTK